MGDGLRRALTFVVAALVALALPRSEAAADGGVPPLLRATVMLRVLAYERRFAAGSGDASVLVIGQGTDANTMSAALSQVSGRFQVAGRRVRVERSSGDPAQIRAWGRRADASVVYVSAAALENPAIRAAIREPRVLVFCESPDELRFGCVLTVEPTDTGSRVVVNLRASSQVGANFDARLLRSARVIR